MGNELATLTLALELSALLPCAAVLLFLGVRRERQWLSLLPALYFIALGSHFLPALLKLMGSEVPPGITFVQNTLPAFTFLLVLQFIGGRVPRWPYWSILALPVGGVPLIYITAISPEVCLDENTCLLSATLITIYRVFGGALVFLLLTSFVQRWRAGKKRIAASQYWLVMAIIAFSLLMLGLDLVKLARPDLERELRFAATMVCVGFIYLVLSSVFRVFHPSQMKPQKSAPLEQGVVAKLEQLMAEQHLYREPELSRRMLAQAVRIPEHLLSKIVNQHYGKSVTDLIHEWRIRDACEKLKSTKDSVTDIAYSSGFQSIASFNRVFKAATGLSASAYRKHST